MAVLREERIEMLDDELEAFVLDGKAKRIGFETSYRLGYQRGRRPRRRGARDLQDDRRRRLEHEAHGAAPA